MKMYDNGTYRVMSIEEIKKIEEEKKKYPPVNESEAQLIKISEVFADE